MVSWNVEQLAALKAAPWFERYVAGTTQKVNNSESFAAIEKRAAGLGRWLRFGTWLTPIVVLRTAGLTAAPGAAV